MRTIESFSVAELLANGALQPKHARAAKRMIAEANTYEYFVDVLYEDLEDCLRRIEEDPQVHRSDTEDRVSQEIINMLSMWYDASHDEKIGGHSDIVVRGPRGFLWVAEAKIHGSYDYMLQGFQQLATRYPRGKPDSDQGALLMYIKNQDCAAVVEKWKEKITQNGLAGLKYEECPIRKELGFRTTHTHTSSGRPVLIRHIGISMHWNPQDT